MTYRFVTLLMAVVAAGAAMADEPPRGIPLKPDPPFAIDGELGDWAAVPFSLAFQDAAQVVWGRSAWESGADLSGTARLAWRSEHLYLAATVTDDALSQQQRGDGIWKGDHVELYIDIRPEMDPARDMFGEGQYHFCFSPGNFLHTGDALVDCAPEAVCYTPAGGAVSGITVGAKRTESGWTIEAAIPWGLLQLDKPVEGTPIAFEIGLSDTDGAEPRQESLMTVGAGEWRHVRTRLMPAVLAAADGTAPEPTAKTAVFDSLTIKVGGTQSLEFTLPATPPGRRPVLAMKGRLAFAQVAGYAQALRLTINGTAVDAERLVNKPARVKARSGDLYSMTAGDRFSTYYSPDFTSPDIHPYYGPVDAIKPCDFEFNIEGLAREGANTLVIEHAAPGVQCDLVVADGQVVFQLPPPPPKPKAGPPTGPLPQYAPRASQQVAYEAVEKPGAVIEVRVAGETFAVESTFSTPRPGWTTGSCDYFTLERQVERRGEAIVVRDRFTNLTDGNLPLMRRNQVRFGERMRRAWLAGLEQGALSGSQSNPSNPTAIAVTDKAGLGFIALDDVARVHVTTFCADGSAGLADHNLVLPPRGVYEAEWAILPVDTPDYWACINAARRLVDANFTIDGGFAFLRADPLTEVWSDEQLANFIRFKDARYVCASITYPRYNGHYSHGTSFQRVTHDNYRTAFERWRTLAPDAKMLVYFHCFIDVIDEGPELFADARVVQSDGTHADYGEPFDRIYFPTESNTYGREIAKSIDVIFDEIKADGVYWDEHEYSRHQYHYGAPWDNCSGDIDPAAMTVARLKSSVTLLTETWRVALAQKILARGPLIGNGPPFTRAMAALHFPCFVETGSITHCTQAHLYSPIALGDHLTERSEADAYRVMLAALDHGCVYHWYNDVTVIPTHHHLTKYMYPFTPVELHAGWVVGEERIITKNSGLFGWGNDAKHEVHVFDDTGNEVPGFVAPYFIGDGKSYTELRLPEDWAAVIVKAAP